MTPDKNGRSPWDRLPSLHLRLVLLELEAHPETVDDGRLAAFLGVPRAELPAARREAWKGLGKDRDALARRARDLGLLIPLTAEQADRLEAEHGPFAPPREEEIRATARRVVAADARAWVFGYR